VTVAVRLGAIYCVPALGLGASPPSPVKIVIIAASARRIRTREPVEENEKLETKERWWRRAGSGRRAVRIRGGERSFPSTSPLDSLPACCCCC
jgi:hypothetical protein